ncbi:MAG: rhomboid family intramembrane serine protease [Solirubrobacterales bacterium]|nr:rhomboid family intramembrane serine protease [Solirubrobacterales bacterium]MCB8970864.1 rhomboid family intramembrane serine protease [Thermoleophilales bacterium]
MPAPELSVVCKSCGSEVSPYVTECPYCGQRLRKRAPKLEREGDEIRVQESRRDRRRRRRTERSIRTVDLDARPLATAATILIGAVLIVLGRSVPLNIYELGAIVGPVGSDLWRYVTAPFVYDDIGYFLVVALAIGVFGASVERRLGSLATGTLILATGTLGMLAAGAADSAGLTDSLIAAGGNGVALGLLGAWLMLWGAEAKTHFSEPLDVIGVSVVAAVLLLLPLVEITADPIAGLVGGLVGLGMGSLAARRADPGPG